MAGPTEREIRKYADVLCSRYLDQYVLTSIIYPDTLEKSEKTTLHFISAHNVKDALQLELESKLDEGWKKTLREGFVALWLKTRVAGIVQAVLQRNHLHGIRVLSDPVALAPGWAELLLERTGERILAERAREWVYFRALPHWKNDHIAHSFWLGLCRWLPNCHSYDWKGEELPLRLIWQDPLPIPVDWRHVRIAQLHLIAGEWCARIWKHYPADWSYGVFEGTAESPGGYVRPEAWTDPRPRRAVLCAQRFALGKIPADVLQEAHRSCAKFAEDTYRAWMGANYRLGDGASGAEYEVGWVAAFTAKAAAAASSSDVRETIGVCAREAARAIGFRWSEREQLRAQAIETEVQTRIAHTLFERGIG